MPFWVSGRVRDAQNATVASIRNLTISASRVFQQNRSITVCYAAGATGSRRRNSATGRRPQPDGRRTEMIRLRLTALPTGEAEPNPSGRPDTLGLRGYKILTQVSCTIGRGLATSRRLSGLDHSTPTCCSNQQRGKVRDGALDFLSLDPQRHSGAERAGLEAVTEDALAGGEEDPEDIGA